MDFCFKPSLVQFTSPFKRTCQLFFGIIEISHPCGAYRKRGEIERLIEGDSRGLTFFQRFADQSIFLDS